MRGTGTTRRTLHLLLSAQSAIVVVVSVNRLSSLTTGYVAPNEFLRWVDLNNMVLGLASVLVYHGLAKHLQAAGRHGLPQRLLDVVFIVGAYLYATSLGNHEITNYLHARFCVGDPGALCRIVVVHDDEVSHLLFFAGFIILNVVVMLSQALSPDSRPPTVADDVLVVVNALVIAAGVAANLAFEEIGIDLFVVAIVAVLAVVLLWRAPRQPVLRYYAIAFAGGWIASVVLIAL